MFKMVEVIDKFRTKKGTVITQWRISHTTRGVFWVFEEDDKVIKIFTGEINDTEDMWDWVKEQCNVCMEMEPIDGACDGCVVYTNNNHFATREGFKPFTMFFQDHTKLARAIKARIGSFA